MQIRCILDEQGKVLSVHRSLSRKKLALEWRHYFILKLFTGTAPLTSELNFP